MNIHTYIQEVLPRPAARLPRRPIYNIISHNIIDYYYYYYYYYCYYYYYYFYCYFYDYFLRYDMI